MRTDYQDLDWPELVAWIEKEGYATSTQLRTAGLSVRSFQNEQTRPKPQDLVDLLLRLGALNMSSTTTLRAMGEKPIKSPGALRQVLEAEGKRSGRSERTSSGRPPAAPPG